MKKTIIKSTDGYELNLHIFEVENPSGVVQVIHGMEEHQERYEEVAKALNEAGLTVITSNMRGHGEGVEILGYFKDKEGYKQLLEDQKTITEFAKKEYGVDKVNLFAHSMGTIIARNLLQTESQNYVKVALSGYPNPQPAVGAGLALSGIVRAFRGPKYFSKTIEAMATGSFNKSVKNPKTNFDWLSYNEQNVQNYIADPYCGHGFKVSAFNDLFHLVKNMGKSSLYKNVNTDLPILTLRGDSDPCIGGEKGHKASYKVLKNAGFKNMNDICYPHMRHEILNEDKKEDVIKDIVNFFK